MLAGFDAVLGNDMPKPMDVERMNNAQGELDLRRQAQAYAMDPNNPENLYRQVSADRLKQMLPLELEKAQVDTQADRLGNAKTVAGMPELYPTEGMVPGIQNEQIMNRLDQIFRMSGVSGVSPAERYKQMEALKLQEIQKQQQGR